MTTRIDIKEYIDDLNNIDYFIRFKKIKKYERKIYLKKSILQLFVVTLFLFYAIILAFYQLYIDTIYKLTLTLFTLLVLVILYNMLLFGYIYPKLSQIELEKNILKAEKHEIDILYPDQRINFNLLNNNKFEF
jgi:amino acid transporter